MKRAHVLLGSLVFSVSLFGACSDGSKQEIASSGTPDPAGSNESFSLTDYFTLVCDYYARCSPEIISLYGGEAECLETNYALGTLNGVDGSSWLRVEEVFDVGCLQDIEQISCPDVGSLDVVYEDYARQLSNTLFACIRNTALPCTEDDDCMVGSVCGNLGDQCGVCEPGTRGCRNALECDFGEVCLEQQCVAGKQAGEGCDVDEQCRSGRCLDNVCVDRGKLGSQCAAIADCDLALRCTNAVCSPPTAEGEDCSADAFGCQIGFGCSGGICKRVGFKDVPLGGLCFGTDSCVPGAKCSSERVCVADANTCTRNGHCPANHYCEKDCIPKAELGQDCTESEECISDFCGRSGTCADPGTCQ